MGALEAPLDRHRQERRTVTSRAEQTDRDHGGAGSSGSHGGAGSSGDHGGAGSSGDHGGAGSSGDHGGAGSSGDQGRWSSGPLASAPSARPLQPEPLLPPPPKNFPGEVRGYQEPSGAKQTGQYKTRQDSPPGPDRQDRTDHDDRKALQGQTDRTGQTTMTGKPSTSATRGQAARMASMATARGATCPRRVSMDKTRQGIFKMFLWAQRDRHTALLAVTCGLNPRGKG